jgi:FkbM family methyltransferase
LVALSNWYLLQRRLGVDQGPATKVRIQHRGDVLEFTVTSATDINVLEEIFQRGDYNVELVKAPNTIVDLGANFGASVGYFCLRYPAARILAFEPAMGTFEQLAKNARVFPNVRIFNEAVTGHIGDATLHVERSRSAGASLLPRAQNTSSESVRTTTLDAIFERERIDWIDLVKFDVEGSEVELFQATRKLMQIGELVGEFHGDLTGITLNEFLKLFRGFRCNELAVYGQRHLVHLTNLAMA